MFKFLAKWFGVYCYRHNRVLVRSWSEEPYCPFCLHEERVGDYPKLDPFEQPDDSACRNLTEVEALQAAFDAEPRREFEFELDAEEILPSIY